MESGSKNIKSGFGISSKHTSSSYIKVQESGNHWRYGE